MAQPLQVDSLDEETRRALEGARLPVRFREAKILAPGEYLAVRVWDRVWYDRNGRAHLLEPTGGRYDSIAEVSDIKPRWTSEDEGRPVLEGEELYTLLEDILTKPEPWY